MFVARERKVSVFQTIHFHMEEEKDDDNDDEKDNNNDDDGADDYEEHEDDDNNNDNHHNDNNNSVDSTVITTTARSELKSTQDSFYRGRRLAWSTLLVSWCLLSEGGSCHLT